ncbi:MAG TPA: alkaline phosphatase family protein [Candidatus Cybelea sp.]
MGTERALACAAFACTLAACGGGQTQAPMMPPLGAVPGALQDSFAQPFRMHSPIRHVVIVFQENRTPDYLFQGLPGADISKWAIDSQGVPVLLQPISLAAGYDLGHGHGSFITDYDDGKMDGFDRGLPPSIHLRPFGYAPAAEVKPYHEMAAQYVFGDHMFQDNEGPSFPSHLYIISGRATDEKLEPYYVAANPREGKSNEGAPGGCDARDKTTVKTIDPLNGSAGPTPYPCFDFPVLSDLLDDKGVTWRHYQDNGGPGIWHGFDAVRHVRYGPDYKNVVWPATTVLSDIKKGRLAAVTWIIPGNTWSDHAGKHSTTQGPSWVAAIVNAIGESANWKDTAIFVTWDDWGGWYDHVPPPIDNFYEVGFRVPLIVISPYARRAYVSKKRHDFGSILAFAEETFGIPKGALHGTDARADDLSDAFDFTQKPRRFKHIKAPPFKPGPYAGLNEEDP